MLRKLAIVACLLLSVGCEEWLKCHNKCVEQGYSTAAGVRDGKCFCDTRYKVIK
jgi:hypothetical protein